MVLYRLIVTKLAASAKPAIAQVVVANHNLEIGTLVKDADVKTVDWNGPEPKGALGATTDVIGRGVVATIYEGEPILENRLAAKGAGGGLAATIPPGMRAVSVRVNDVARRIRFRAARRARGRSHCRAIRPGTPTDSAP